MGKFIEDAGFSVLYLVFYLWEGLSKEMWRIPADYAERAAKWLVSHGLGVGEMTDEMGGRIKTALAYRAMGVKKELADRARQDVLDWLDAWAGKREEHEGL